MSNKIDQKLQSIIAMNYGDTAHLVSVHKPTLRDCNYGRSVRHVEIKTGAQAALTGGSHTCAMAHAGKILSTTYVPSCSTLTITVWVEP
jgi:hypothetical protein